MPARVKLSCCGAFGEGYVEAELVEPLGEAIGRAGALGALEVVGAEVVIIHPAPEHDVHRREDRPGHRHNGLLRTPAGLQSQKQRPEVAALGSDPAPGRLETQTREGGQGSAGGSEKNARRKRLSDKSGRTRRKPSKRLSREKRKLRNRSERRPRRLSKTP